MQPLRVGVVGTGNISPIYLKTLAAFRGTTVTAVADLDSERAAARAAEYGVPRVLSPEALVHDPEVDLVLNLTIPAAHYALSKQALEAGKHVYVEKPLSAQKEEGAELVALAKAKGLRLGCAPDTVLGAGIQTSRKLIEDGAIGQLVGANFFMMCGGHESWHPSPEFYYEVGGGPMFDMGPYYIHAAIQLLGPIRQVKAATRISFAERTITSQPKAGKVVRVETPTHYVGILEFAEGAIGQITTSFDVRAHSMPCIEVYGSEGSLLVPDPNGFGGPVKLNRGGGYEEVPLSHAYPENARGLGVLDIAYALAEGRPHRASGEVAQHALEAFHGLLSSGEGGGAVELSPLSGRPAPMPQEGLEP